MSAALNVPTKRPIDMRDCDNYRVFLGEFEVLPIGILIKGSDRDSVSLTTLDGARRLALHLLEACDACDALRKQPAVVM